MSFPRPSGSPHHFLAQLSGTWSGKTKLWIEPDVLAEESPTQGSIQIILEGRFAIYLYQSSVDGEAQHGMFTFGYNTTLQQYEASWLDSYHNNSAIMFCVGMAKGKGFAVTGSYPDPAEGLIGIGVQKLSWSITII